ncbi:MAG: RecX family transcriptional regulator, partial [Thermoanaerobaculia bacterium]|nr:RecX family transcriptional regulator [Thermoanaerobaculia bacterium]
QRGISPAIILEAMETIGEEEYLRVLQRLIEKRRQQWPSPNDAAARSKTAAAMIRAGYEPELIFRYL